METNNVRLPVYFFSYVVGTGLLFLFLPRLLGLAPWDYAWVFVVVTPPLAGAALIARVGGGSAAGRSGRFSSPRPFWASRTGGLPSNFRVSSDRGPALQFARPSHFI